jgi:hypothetical protein
MCVQEMLHWLVKHAALLDHQLHRWHVCWCTSVLDCGEPIHFICWMYQDTGRTFVGCM